MNPNEFMKRWIEGMKNLTPAQQLHGKLVGTIGGVVGLILALITLIIRKQWGFSVFIFFMIWIQVITLIGMRQQYKATVMLQEELEKNEVKEMIEEAKTEAVWEGIPKKYFKPKEDE